MTTEISWTPAFEADPPIEYTNGGITRSVSVLACDEDMEMYIARCVIDRRNNVYWVEDCISGNPQVIPNIVLWAMKPKMKI